MLRGANQVAIAVRTPGGEIVIRRQKIAAWGKKWPVFRFPLLRGLAALVESLMLGMESLVYSADLAGEEEEKLSRSEMGVTIVVSLLIGTLVFVVLPTVFARLLRNVIPSNFWLNIVEFGIRIAFFLIYLVLISQMREVQSLFQYHGAEHKVVHTYEAGLPLDVENARLQTTLHPRCGTAFLLVVFFVSMFFFAFLGWSNLLLRILSRVALMPIIAGVSYEMIRVAGKSCSPFVKWLIYPGLMLQKLTTREPDDRQLEVALAAMRGVLQGTHATDGGN